MHARTSLNHSTLTTTSNQAAAAPIITSYYFITHEKESGSSTTLFLNYTIRENTHTRAVSFLRYKSDQNTHTLLDNIQSPNWHLFIETQNTSRPTVGETRNKNEQNESAQKKSTIHQQFASHNLRLIASDCVILSY